MPRRQQSRPSLASRFWGEDNAGVDRREHGHRRRCRAFVRSLPRNAAGTAQHGALRGGGAGEVGNYELHCFLQMVGISPSSPAKPPVGCGFGPSIRSTLGRCREPTEWPGARTRFSGHRTAPLGFVAQNTVEKRSPSTAGRPNRSPRGARPHSGPAWGREGVILLATGAGSPIQRLPESSGVPVAVTKLRTTPGRPLCAAVPARRAALSLLRQLCQA